MGQCISSKKEYDEEKDSTTIEREEEGNLHVTILGEDTEGIQETRKGQYQELFPGQSFDC